MKNRELSTNKTKKVWISTTGYRILVIFKSLLENSCTIDEFITILKSNPITNKSLSKDTIRIAISTLKRAGCKIARPSKANNYKYQLLEHPFSFSLSDKELRAFLNLREKYSQELDWKSILLLNSLYSKIVSLTFNQEQISFVESSRPLANVDSEILSEISNPKLKGKKICVLYDSPKYGHEELDVIPQKITNENGKLYLWCYVFKYKMNSVLNIERIVKINTINMFEEFDVNSIYEVTYQITGESVLTFDKKDNEKVIEQTENQIKVLAQVENEFLFIQRILQYGRDFRVISPEFFKEKLVNKINLIKKGYEE